MQQHLQQLREAAQTRHKVRLRYHALSDEHSERTLRPLGCFFWGQVWTLAAWCETRQAFRSFRLDRMTQLERLDERFRDEAGKTLADLLREVGAQARRERA